MSVRYPNYWYSVLILQQYGTITPDIQVLPVTAGTYLEYRY